MTAGSLDCFISSSPRVRFSPPLPRCRVVQRLERFPNRIIKDSLCMDSIEIKRSKNREYVRKYLSDPENRRKHIERVKRNADKDRQKRKELIKIFRSNGCVICDEQEECCLVAHHINPEDKNFNIGDALGQGIGLKRFKAELEKCICVCHNCHCKIHAGILTVG